MFRCRAVQCSRSLSVDLVQGCRIWPGPWSELVSVSRCLFYTAPRIATRRCHGHTINNNDPITVRGPRRQPLETCMPQDSPQPTPPLQKSCFPASPLSRREALDDPQHSPPPPPGDPGLSGTWALVHMALVRMAYVQRQNSEFIWNTGPVLGPESRGPVQTTKTVQFHKRNEIGCKYLYSLRHCVVSVSSCWLSNATATGLILKLPFTTLMKEQCQKGRGRRSVCAWLVVPVITYTCEHYMSRLLICYWSFL